MFGQQVFTLFLFFSYKIFFYVCKCKSCIFCISFFKKAFVFRWTIWIFNDYNLIIEDWFFYIGFVLFILLCIFKKILNKILFLEISKSLNWAELILQDVLILRFEKRLFFQEISFCFWMMMWYSTNKMIELNFYSVLDFVFFWV